MAKGNDRNKPCHCGSGKKYKNCCYHKEMAPRYRGFTFTVPKDVSITGIEMRGDGAVRLRSGSQIIPLNDVRVTEWRDSSKGLRPTSSISINDQDEISFDPEALVGAADFVFGVDTNSVILGDQKINISCLTCATRAIAPSGFEGSIQQIQCVDFVDEEDVAERLGWVFAIEAIRRSMPYPNVKLILCTDHDLKAHAEINRREQPLVERYFLPPGFTLVYARDRGSTIQNKVVAAAHKGATRVAEAIMQNPPPPQFIKQFLLGNSSVRVRRWKNSENSKFFFG